MNIEKVIQIDNLNVTINNTVILNLNRKLVIEEGDIVGVIGANGAGKSTLVNCIIDKIKYTGRIERNFQSSKLGIQFQNNSYNSLMKVYEIIQIVTNEIRFDHKLNEMIYTFELDNLLKKKISKLSGGERQRLTLFLMLYLRPSFLIFDELTTGLDYQKRVKMLDIVKKYSCNKTVLTITHYYEELNNWANKILILHKGQVAFWGTVEELDEKNAHFSILKIKNSVDTLFNNIMSNKTKIIKPLDGGNDGIVAQNLKEQNDFINIFSNNGITFEVIPKSIYTLYLLEIFEMEVKSI